MNNYPIKSIFEEISEMVFKSKLPLTELKQKTIEFVDSKGINDKDKKTIIQNINNSNSMLRFQTYICNSLLQYEGLGMNQIRATKNDDLKDKNFKKEF
jgi:hypothetical protein